MRRLNKRSWRGTRNWKRFRKRRIPKRLGVPIGYPENWKYVGRWKEKKIAPRTWKFTFQATKRRKSRGLGGFGIGTKGVWNIKAKQYITKTNKGEYQTKMVGIKKSMGFKVKKPKKY